MPQTTDDPRQLRRVAETLDAFQLTEGHPQFRVDVERIRFSPYYSRLSAVTQVISQTGAGLAVHNRLTHSIKVAAIARAIASHLSTRADDAGRVVEDLGGAHPVVVQAAAAAHDLGHPPFGHLGEQTLDRVARRRFGLTEVLLVAGILAFSAFTLVNDGRQTVGTLLSGFEDALRG